VKVICTKYMTVLKENISLFGLPEILFFARNVKFVFDLKFPLSMENFPQKANYLHRITLVTERFAFN